jgi:hypothetical protein
MRFMTVGTHVLRMSPSRASFRKGRDFRRRSSLRVCVDVVVVVIDASVSSALSEAGEPSEESVDFSVEEWRADEHRFSLEN